MFNRDFGNYNYKCDHHLKIMPYNVIKEMTPNDTKICWSPDLNDSTLD
jgi:hypothetical protein